MSPSTHPQKVSSLRGVIRIPVKRPQDESTIINGDNRCQNNDLCPSNNLPELSQNHPYSLISQAARPYTSQPMLGRAVEEDDVAGRRSIDHPGPSSHEGGGSRFPSPEKLSTPLETYHPGQTSGNPRVRSSPLAAADATRLRHVPRGPVARSHPTVPPTVTHNDDSKYPCQKTPGNSKAISNGLLNGTQTGFAILGIGVGVGMDRTGATKTKADASFRLLEESADTMHKEVEALSHGSGHDTSPAAPTAKTNPKLPTPHDHKPPTSIRPLASLQRDINKQPIHSRNEVQHSSSVSMGTLVFEVSAAVGHSEGQGNSDSSSAVERKVRPIVRPLPALPGECSNETGSASKSSSSPVSNDLPTSPHKMDNGRASDLRCSIAGTPTILDTHNPQLRSAHPPLTRSKTTTNNKGRFEDDTLTPTIPFPAPKRSMTIGVPTLSRNAKPPPLSLPPLDRRLSFKGLMEGKARLSPSVIIRPPPLPLVNLPVLVTPSTDAGPERTEAGNGQTERRRSRLMMSMPALPLQGSSRGTRGHEEADDLEEDDEEEGEEDEEDETNDGVSGQNSASSSSRIETPGSGLDSDTSMDGDEKQSSQTLSRKSSYETARAEPSPLCWDNESTSVMDASNNTSSASRLWPRLPYVDSMPLSGTASDPSMVLDRKSTGKLDSSRLSFVGPGNDADCVGKVAKGKMKQEVGDDEGNVIEDVLPAVKGHGGRGVEVKPSDIGAGSGAGDGGSSSKAIATHEVKVAQVYDSEGSVLERRVGSGTGGVRLNSNNPSTSGAENGASPCYPLSSELWCAAGSTAEKERGSTWGSSRPGDRAMRSNNKRLSTSTTPLGSPKLRPSRVGGSLGHNETYKRASRSLIDVHAIETKERVEKMVRDREEEEERKRSSRVLKLSVLSRKAKESGVWQPEAEDSSVGHSGLHSESGGSGSGSGKTAEMTTIADAVAGGKTATTQESSIHPLRRRHSMPTADPPSYAALFDSFPPGLRQELNIQPREDEGKEKLPPYTNDIFLKAVMPRKMEFSSPGVQAKDRKWRRVLCVLDGTALRVYKCPARSAGVSAFGEWWENTVGVGDSGMDTGPGPGSSGGLASGTSGGETGSALAREIELARARKSREGGEVGQPVLQINNNSAVDRPPQLRPHSPLPKPPVQNHQSALSPGVTKSALTLAVQLLKPSATRHMRSNSEASQVTGASSCSEPSRRASLNIPRGSTSGRTTPSSGHTGNDGPGSGSTHLTNPGTSGGRSRPVTPSSGRNEPLKTRQPTSNKLKGKRVEQDPEPDESNLLRVYSMQHAESGLGKDYTKRQHVIRVRLEGEQFLLQTKSVESVIGWIEGLQSAANVALDLDERPMPAGPMLPRRRRRRRVGVAAGR